MAANRRVDTKPELALRSALHRAGYRFRKDHRIEAGSVKVRPDVIFTRQRVAVFVDGCFWHCCPTHGRQPQANEWYWEPKLARNRARDITVTAALMAHGWTVRRYWEHVETADMIDNLRQVLQPPPCAVTKEAFAESSQDSLAHLHHEGLGCGRD